MKNNMENNDNHPGTAFAGKTIGTTYPKGTIFMNLPNGNVKPIFPGDEGYEELKKMQEEQS